MRGRLAAAVAGVGAVMALGAPGTAGAAVTVGETFAPTAGCGGGTLTTLQSVSPGNQYAVPSAGVITSWSWQSGASVPASLRLQVARPLGGSSFLSVGRSEQVSPGPSVINTYPTRISVRAGDVIGYAVATMLGYTCVRPNVGWDYIQLNGDPAPGTTNTWLAPTPGLQFPISAKVEPDADNDGFGDETQDLCPTDAATAEACRDKAAPETTIGKKPKKKDSKKKATFEFGSSEAGATFRCSLNGAAFAPCTSPHSVKAKKGLNVFTVFAKDAAGNVDDSPATFSWKYKKKR